MAVATKRDFSISYGLQTDRTGASTGNTFAVDQVNDRVGIGNANPGYKLDVNGDINFTGGLYKNGAEYYASRWTLTGSDIYRLSNVGVGVDNPNARLTVKDEIVSGINVARLHGTVIDYSSQFGSGRVAANVINGKKTFEGNADWLTLNGQYIGAYVTIDLGTSYKITRAVIYNQNEYTNGLREVKDFRLQASTNNSTWVDVLDSQLGISDGAEPNPGWTFDIPQSFGDDVEGLDYRYWKFIIDSTHNNDGYAGLTEIELYTDEESHTNGYNVSVSTAGLISQSLHTQYAYTESLGIGAGYGGYSNSGELIVKGKIGVGLTNPTYALDVIGGIRASSGLYLGQPDTASAHINSYELMTYNIDIDNDDANTRYFGWFKNASSGAGTQLMLLSETGALSVNGYITESTDSGTTYWNVVTQQDIGTDANQVPLNQYLGKLAFLDDFSPNGLRREGGSSDDVVVNSSGNVGVGTGSTTLATKFHVLGSNTVARFESSTSYVDLQLSNSSSANSFIQYNGTTLRFFANSGSTPTLNITGGSPGNVGIGVLDPIQRLEVSGRTVITTGAGPFYGLKVKDYTNTTGLYLGSVSGGNAWYIGDSYYFNSNLWRTDKTAASSINFINGSVEFYTNSGLTAGVDFTPSRKAILDVNGNLLLNSATATGTASQPLQVNGGAYISTNLGINDGNPAGKSLALSVRVNDTRYFGVVSASSAPVYRYDDNSLPSMLLQNYGMTAIGHGQGITWQLGNSSANSTNAAGIYAQAETIWSSGGGSKNAYLSIQTTSSGVLNEKVRITSVGDVGIGLSPFVPNDGDMTIGTPRLHVLGSENAGSYQLAARFQAGSDSDDTGSAILINHANDRGLLIEAGRKTNDQAVAYFGLVNSSGINSRFLTAIEGGNVGIATTVPLQKLDVRGNFLLAADSTTATHITQRPYTINGGTLSWEGSAGQLFSITNSLTSGSIFSVNDVSGIPSIDVDADGTITLAEFGGNVGVGTSNPIGKLHISVTNTAASQAIILQTINSTSSNSTIRWKNSAGTDGSFIGSNYNVSDANGNLEFGRGNTTNLLITSSGNVGVGTGATVNYKLEVNGSFAATTKSFVIDHPTKTGMKLRYGSLEGPENGVYVRGKTTEFVIELPDYWTGLVDADTISVNLTPIGKSQILWVKSIEDNKVIVGSKCTSVEYFYTIYGERKDVEKLEVEIGA